MLGGNSDNALGIKIDYKTIPLFDGVSELFEKGYFASIAGNNYESLSSVLSADMNNQNFPALFDPQTSGGLLFSVSSHQTEDCLKALYQNGVKACVIGEVIDENKIIILWLNADAKHFYINNGESVAKEEESFYLMRNFWYPVDSVFNLTTD